MTSKTVLLLGASGKIGPHARRAFDQRGWAVRTYTRGTDMAAAAQGAQVIVNGLNPPNYRNWAKNIPQITEAVIGAAQASGATVIVPGNVYNFGTQSGPWDETTPQVPCSVKGQIRVDMERRYRASGVRTIVLRAGNFIDPNRNKCVMSLIYLTQIQRGRLVHPGDPDVAQAYAWLPDWAEAAAALAEQRERLARFEDVPFAGHNFTARALAQGLGAHLGRQIALRPFGWGMVRRMRPIWPLMRELWEMKYLWDLPHHLDDTKLRRLLPDFRPTELGQVMAGALPPQTARVG